jgi:hypothetical protein
MQPDQLTTLAELHRLLQSQVVDYWLFGGWAVDFHAGRITREHGDIDVAVWERDAARLADLLAAQGWEHQPETGEDGYTAYERGPVRLEVAFLARGEDGRVYTPLRNGRAEWPDEAFGNTSLALRGVEARVIERAALIAEKSAVRDDPVIAATDRADLANLAASD